MDIAEIAVGIAARKPALFRRVINYAGSFDPFATHHLRVIDLLINLKHFMMQADRSVPVDIVVWPIGAYASKMQVADPEDRREMLQRGLGDRKVALHLDDLEHDTFSYTSTHEMQNHFALQHRTDLQREYGVPLHVPISTITEVWHVIGTDNVGHIKEWNEGLNLWKQSCFIVIGRPGVALAELPPKGIVLSAGNSDDVSSTNIRKLIAAKQPWEHLVPEAVASYIKEHGLYRPRQAAIRKKG